MYICICSAVGDQAIRELIRNGATNVKTVTDKFHIGHKCAKCVGDIKALITETLMEQHTDKGAVRCIRSATVATSQR